MAQFFYDIVLIAHEAPHLFIAQFPSDLNNYRAAEAAKLA